MSNTSIVHPPIATPPTPIPPLIDAWLRREFNLSPAVARTVAELAFPPAANWIGARR